MISHLAELISITVHTNNTHFFLTKFNRKSAELAVFFPSLVYGVVENKGGRKRLNLCRILSEVPKVAKTREGKKAEGGGKRQLISLIVVHSRSIR